MTALRSLASNNTVTKGAFVVAGAGIAALVGMLAVSGTAFGVSYGNGYGTPTGSVDVHRAFSPVSGDHLLTTSGPEQAAAVASGYNDEGVAFKAYTTSPAGGRAVYRAYNAKANDHFYTTSLAEYTNAVLSVGYKSEGIAMYAFGSAPDATNGLAVTEVYRTLTPVLRHFYTANAAESDQNALHGSSEGVAFVVPVE